MRATNEDFHDGECSWDSEVVKKLQNCVGIMKRDLERIEQIKVVLGKAKTWFERKGGDELKRYWTCLLEAQRVYGIFEQRYVVEEGGGGE
eukprot:3498690-Rhodomonas_salina.1